MLKEYKKLIFLFLIILYGELCFTGGLFLYKHNQPPKIQNAKITLAPKKYINQDLNFSIEYPHDLNVVQYNKDSVTFQYGADEGWLYNVSATTTNFKSLNNWLDAQPKGNIKSAGYEPFLNLGDGKILLTKYIITDSYKNKPLYEKTLEAVYFQNGMLYIISFRNITETNSIPGIGLEQMEFIYSFQTIK